MTKIKVKQVKQYPQSYALVMVDNEIDSWHYSYAHAYTRVNYLRAHQNVPCGTFKGNKNTEKENAK